MSRITQIGKPHPKVKFSLEEDIKLRLLVMQFGDENWNLISSLMKDRNPRQCRERWLKYLSPMNRYEPFTPEEDKMLIILVHKFGQKWVKISKFFHNRTDVSVKNRWHVIQRHNNRQIFLTESIKNMQQENSAPKSQEKKNDTICTSKDNLQFIAGDIFETGFFDDSLSSGGYQYFDLMF